MKILQKALLILLCMIFSAVLTAGIKSAIFTYDDGWTGIAGVLGGLMLGAALGLVIGILLVSKIDDKQLWKWVMLAFLINTVLILSLVLFNKQDKVKSQYFEREDVSISNLHAHSIWDFYDEAFRRDLNALLITPLEQTFCAF